MHDIIITISREREREREMDYSTLLLWVSCIWVFFQALQMVVNKYSTAKLPPGPLPLPLIGSLHKIGKNPHYSLAELAKTHGPLMTLQLGLVTAIVVSSATMAKEVLQKHDQILAGRLVPDAIRTLGHDESALVSSQPNQHWRRLRAICTTQMFTTQRLDSHQLQDLRRLKVQDLIAHVREKSLSGQAVEIIEATFVTTLNLISNTIFSVDLVGANFDSAQEFYRVVRGIVEDAARPNVVDFFPFLRPLDPQGARRRMTAYFKRLHAIFDEMIDLRLQNRQSSSPDSSTKNDFLDSLLDKAQSGGLSREHIKALLVDLFVAGSEPNATTVEWAMAELLKNPKVMAKAQSELIENISKGKPVEESDISRLPYLQAVVNETFRLRSIVPLLVHKAESKVEFGGFTIPKNSQVLVNLWAIGRDPDTWVNPTSFIPERFLGSNKDYKGRDFEFIPFGAGRRICPGLPLAFRMVHLMLASLLHSFAWELPDGITPEDLDMSPRFGATLRKEVPLRAIPVSHRQY